ncbi:hypothetical protein ACFYWP_37915 [Actinacidiphila glaucinigra]|uniref:hypothetical protein n=1 Tax=Actinacidiphila glaucinigra TaxID=235986 RepID=UPI003677F9D8
MTTDMIREVLPCLEAAKEQPVADCPAAADLEGLKQQLSGIERRIDVLRRNRDAIKRYLRVWEEAAKPLSTDSTCRVSRHRVGG